MADSTVFTNNRTQAVRLPAQTRFPDTVKKVVVRVVGVERIVAPINAAWDSFFLCGPLLPTDEFMAERVSQKQAAREPLEEQVPAPTPKPRAKRKR